MGQNMKGCIMIRLLQIVLCVALLQILGVHPAFADAPAPSYFGAIDLGSRGVKAYLYRFVKVRQGMAPSAVFKEDINTKLVSTAQNNRFTPAGIDEATQAVAALLAKMKAKAAELNIADPNYYVVGSSGVASFENREDLKKSVSKATGLDLSFVDAAEEAKGGYASAVPKTAEADSLFVDIGSGNTKVTCKVKDSFNPVDLRFGTVTTRTKAVGAGGEYGDALKTLVDGEVSQSYESERMNTPCLASRKRVYMIGGAVWAMATLAHPEGAYWSYLELTRNDVDSVLRRLKDGTYTNDPVIHFAAAVPESQQAAVRAEAGKNRKKVFDTFSKEDLMAGASLVRLMMSKSSPGSHTYFARNGNYLYGYAIVKYASLQVDSKPDPLLAGN